MPQQPSVWHNIIIFASGRLQWTELNMNSLVYALVRFSPGMCG